RVLTQATRFPQISSGLTPAHRRDTFDLKNYSESRYFEGNKLLDSTFRLARGYPGNPDVGGRADAIDQLRSVMLDVADINELVLQLGHLIPTEATLGAIEIQRIHRVVDHPIAELPIFEHVRLRIRVTAGAVAFAMVLFPQPERSFVVLEIQVREEQRVIRQLPERILVVGAQPLLRRAALDGFAEHRQRRVILALQDGSKHRMRVAHGLRLYIDAALLRAIPMGEPNRTTGTVRTESAIRFSSGCDT